MTCINWVRVRNGARPSPFRGGRSITDQLSGSRTIDACRVGRCSIFLSRKKGQTCWGFPLSWRSAETAFPTVTLGVDSCSALRAREAVAGSNSATTRTGDPVGWQSLPVWPPIQDKFTLLCWIKKKERINLDHSSALIWQHRKSVYVWNLHYREARWIRCLKTAQPEGMNIRTDQLWPFRATFFTFDLSFLSNPLPFLKSCLS